MAPHLQKQQGHFELPRTPDAASHGCKGIPLIFDGEVYGQAALWGGLDVDLIATLQYANHTA